MGKHLRSALDAGNNLTAGIPDGLCTHEIKHPSVFTGEPENAGVLIF